MSVDPVPDVVTPPTSHHGTSPFLARMTAGAFAALDQVVDATKPGAGGRPLWPERFGYLVSAYDSEQRGDVEAVQGYLRRAEIAGDGAAIGDAVVAALGGERMNERLFTELFGWWPRGTVETYAALPLRFRPIWICHILCCALSYRRNTFGRYFPPTAVPIASDAQLEALSAQMNEAFETAAGDAAVPAGFVFFGQFVDHTITLDTTTRLSDIAVDPETIVNVRSPALDLDNVYGDGPDGSPELYDTARGAGFLLVGPAGKDLARNQVDVAIIGDPRNDENTIVSQLHLHMLHFHNAVLRMVKTTPVNALWGRDAITEPTDAGGDFAFARRMVRWHYQWTVVNDWLPRVVEATTLQAAHAITGVPQGTVVPALPAGFAAAQTFFDSLSHITCCGVPVCRPLMPVEFSAAAFRFAHSQVRSRYHLNDTRTDVPLFVPRPPGLASFGPVPAEDLIDWARFFEVDPAVTPQGARIIDTFLSAQVFQLPFAPGEPNLAFRNLRRGVRVFSLPTGEEVQAALGLASALGPVATAKLAAVGIPAGQTPLWFYVLGEAEAHGGLLGPVGGLLVAATLFRLLQCDDSSYVHSAGWQPVLVLSNPGVFTVADLLHIAVEERLDAFPA